MSDPTYISFTERDLAAFSEASRDRNPLHLSREYARSTPYGQPVAFGCLGAMACLGHIHLPAGWRATSLEAEFFRPMFAGISYRVETSEKEGKWEVRLLDGSAHAALVTVTAEASHEGQAPEQGVAASSATTTERREAVVRKSTDIIPGLSVSGVYGCNAQALAGVMKRWGVADCFLATLLCWSSYVVGMELPGESALFFKLKLHFRERAQAAAAMAYKASVAYSGFGQIKIEVSLLNGGSPVASGQFWSYLRPPLPEVDAIDSTGVKPDALAGRTVVLIGASRGLGAAMKQALELRGAAVYGLSRSPDVDDSSRTEVGDAADLKALQRLRERILRERSSLDFLICNACPPLLPLLLEPNSTERIGDYIRQAVSLTLAPLTEFLDLLNRSDGCAVIISSSAVEQPVREWPHYVAAKRAVEAIGSIASMQYPRVRTLIVRPQKLLTALTNTPMGRVGAALPGLLANRIAARLEAPLEAGKTEILG